MTGPDRGNTGGGHADSDGGGDAYDVVNLPNIITFGRLCAVPFAVWLVLRHQLDWAFGLFALAGVSDAVDGWLARRGGGSALGAILDPVADKALLICMFVTLAAMGVLPDWIAILVVFRDVVIMGGLVVLWMLSRPVRIAPLFVSKANTALQILLVGVVLLLEGFALRAPWLQMVLIWSVAATTLWSGALYVWKAARVR